MESMCAKKKFWIENELGVHWTNGYCWMFIYFASNCNLIVYFNSIKTRETNYGIRTNLKQMYLMLKSNKNGRGYRRSIVSAEASHFSRIRNRTSRGLYSWLKWRNVEFLYNSNLKVHLLLSSFFKFTTYLLKVFYLSFPLSLPKNYSY